MILSNREIKLTDYANYNFLILFFGFGEQCFDYWNICSPKSAPFQNELRP